MPMLLSPSPSETESEPETDDPTLLLAAGTQSRLRRRPAVAVHARLLPDSSAPGTAISCGSERDADDWWDARTAACVPFLPLPLDGDPRRTPLPSRAPRTSTGCGTRVHGSAHAARGGGRWVGYVDGVEATVVRLGSEYFAEIDRSSLGLGVAGCECAVDGVGCAVCGNALGALHTHCRIHQPRKGQAHYVFLPAAVSPPIKDATAQYVSYVFEFPQIWFPPQKYIYPRTLHSASPAASASASTSTLTPTPTSTSTSAPAPRPRRRKHPPAPRRPRARPAMGTRTPPHLVRAPPLHPNAADSWTPEPPRPARSETLWSPGEPDPDTLPRPRTPPARAESRTAEVARIEAQLAASFLEAAHAVGAESGSGTGSRMLVGDAAEAAFRRLVGIAVPGRLRTPPTTTTPPEPLPVPEMETETEEGEVVERMEVDGPANSMPVPIPQDTNPAPEAETETETVQSDPAELDSWLIEPLFVADSQMTDDPRVRARVGSDGAARPGGAARADRVLDPADAASAPTAADG
ncbi:hypothetical protein MVEN_00705300 [Mycena venus]|uniref:Uncharacterized protein n=1 Tax=Mycena venus TaxID=2733690 RepID=A0A8H7D5M2_9AGAR|nr:hypothetical protein MVEN_00705300 [Mycena venus]